MAGKIRVNQIALAVSLVTALAACNGTADSQAPEPAAPVTEVSEVPAVAKPDPKLSVKDQVARSVNDLARRLNVASTAVRVSGATPVHWRSGAIGCPEPGMNYTQALVDGVWIMLWVENAAYRYHAVTGGHPFYCPTERAEMPAMGAGAD